MTLLTYHRPLIYTRATWGASWTERATLQAVSAASCIAPEVSKALLRQVYGSKKIEGATSFATEAPLDLRDHYVKIASADPLFSWYGVVAQQGTQILGKSAADPTGIMEFGCFGLEHLLDRVVIDTGYVRLSGDVLSTIGYAPSFNSRATRTGSVVGNRHTQDNASLGGGAYDGAGVYRFSGIAGDLWTDLDILRYLLHFFGPTGIAPWLISGQYADLGQITEVHDLDGLTLREALNKVIDRRLGYGWCVRADDGNASVHVFSLFASNLTAGALTFNANAEQIPFDVSLAEDVKTAVVLRDRSQIYDSIRVRGARIKSTFTLEAADMFKGWSDAQEAAYLAGASLDAGYAALTLPEKVAANDQRRAGDDLANVYTLFILGRAWPWLVYQPPGTPVQTQAAPAVDAAGELVFTGAPQVYDGPRQFLANLPLEEGRDYGVAGFGGEAPAAAEVSFRRPFVLLADRSVEYRFADDLGTPHIPDAQVTPERNEMALRVRFRPAHIMAFNKWPPALGGFSDPAPSQYVPIFDWTLLIATVCVETDQHIQVVAAAPGAPLAEYARALVLDIPDAELWYVADGTVVGVDAAGAVRRIYNAYPVGDPLWTPVLLRDDRDHLRAIAALAAQWYGVERAAAHLEVTQLDDYAAPGSLITTITGGASQVFTVNSVVSRQAWDFLRGVTEIDTGWWDVDWRRVAPVDKYRMPDHKSLLRYVETLDAKLRETRGAFA